jgi:pimeloyl-ACP methyl ester carboxylesterase
VRGLIGAALIGIPAAVGWAGSAILLRRRTPDPADPPANYALDAKPVTFFSRDHLPLCGWWITPDTPTGRTLVIVHGHNGSLDGDTEQTAALVRQGFNVLLFNLRAHGTSAGRHVTFGAREYLDVLGALDWLQATHGIASVGLVGFSMGAGVALRTAALDRRVAVVVADGTISRVVDGLIGMGRARNIPAGAIWPFAAAILLTASLRAGVWIPAADPIRWVAQVTCPVLFIHGTDDPFNTTAGAGRLAVRANHGQLWLVPGAGHRDAYQHDPDAYYSRVGGFLRQWVRG